MSGEKTKLKALTDELSAKEKKLKEVTEQHLLTGHQSDHARRMSERHGSLSPTPSQSASQAGDYWLVSCQVKNMQPFISMFYLTKVTKKKMVQSWSVAVSFFKMMPTFCRTLFIIFICAVFFTLSNGLHKCFFEFVAQSV